MNILKSVLWAILALFQAKSALELIGELKHYELESSDSIMNFRRFERR